MQQELFERRESAEDDNAFNNAPPVPDWPLLDQLPSPSAAWSPEHAPGGGGWGLGGDDDDGSMPLEEEEVHAFVAKLGFGADRPEEEREQAIAKLWRHARLGPFAAGEVASCPGALSLIVRVQTAGALAHLSTNESAERRQKICEKIVGMEVVPTLTRMITAASEDEREAAVVVVANLALTRGNWAVLVEFGIISQLAKIINEECQVSKAALQRVRAVLTEMAGRDAALKSAVIEEGLAIVPLVGASAYASFKPLLQEEPRLPEKLGQKIKLVRTPPEKDVFGAGKLLLGLQLPAGAQVDAESAREMEGRVRQKFLARLGLLEPKPKEGAGAGAGAAAAAATASAAEPADGGSSSDKVTVMPWWDGVARLVLILGLENADVAARAADAVADFAIAEDHRQAIRRAGAVPQLVRLLSSGNEAATAAAASALERLALSPEVRRSIDSHGAIEPLVAVLCADSAPPDVKEKVQAPLLNSLVIGLVPGRRGRALGPKVRAGAVPGLVEMLEAEDTPSHAKLEAEEILEEISLKTGPREKIVAAGGVPPLVALLGGGGPLAERERAGHVLLNLLLDPANAEVVIREGAISALENILSLRDLDAGEEGGGALDPTDGQHPAWLVVRTAVNIVTKLARLEPPRHREALASSGVVPALTSLLRSKSTPLDVKDVVSEAILTVRHVSLDPEVTAYGTIPRLIGQINDDAPPPSRKEAVSVLQNLAAFGRPEYLAAIADFGGIFPLVQLLDDFNQPAREAALTILAKLGENDENHPAMVAAGAPSALEKVIRLRYVEESEPWKKALGLLKLLRA
eukprot:jgi/Mesen1/8088/ME000434S07338